MRGDAQGPDARAEGGTAPRVRLTSGPSSGSVGEGGKEGGRFSLRVGVGVAASIAREPIIYGGYAGSCPCLACVPLHYPPNSEGSCWEFALDLIYAVAAVAEGAVVFRTPEVQDWCCWRAPPGPAPRAGGAARMRVWEPGVTQQYAFHAPAGYNYGPGPGQPGALLYGRAAVSSVRPARVSLFRPHQQPGVPASVSPSQAMPPIIADADDGAGAWVIVSSSERRVRVVTAGMEM
ncbi:hypothetical protein DFH11DRAFT_1793654 [Phellopilus nigrolimitatus]|nr:hypothetical protein DFH11DRAFT_1793654 [Phellopilus nigrolimitatus]